MFESKRLTAVSWEELAGQRVELSDGAVYYELGGPADGELVVLIHGMSVPLFVWDPTYDALIEMGFRVLRYDLFGRGFSDRPATRYDAALYTRQLLDLLKALQLDGKRINVVGLSLGGAIAALLALARPKLVRRLCLIDPIHPVDMPPPPGGILRQTVRFKPIRTAVIRRILAGLSNNLYQYEAFPHFEEKFTEQLQYEGFARAIVSTLFDFDFDELPDVYEQVGAFKIPTCLIWGEEDALTAYGTHEIFKQLMPHLEFYGIAEAGHLSHYERPALVNLHLVRFLQGT